MSAVNFKPPNSLLPFFVSRKFISLVIGAVGSCKTAAGIMKIAHHAAQMHPCKDGIRRSRAIWVRNTRTMLWDTSIPDFLSWFPEGVAGTLMRTEMRFHLKFNDVECEVLFRGLDDANDVRRLLSLQATFFIFDEFREINPEVFKQAQTRINRYPDKRMVLPQPDVHAGGCIREDGTPAGQVWGMSNPPDADTYWEQYFNDPPETAACFVQPSGMSEEADWLHYLSEGYYENLAASNDKDWVDVYVHAKFGKSLAGKPIFGEVFNYDFHVAKEELQPLPPGMSDGRPLIIGMDFGLTPAVTISQQDHVGRFLTLDEITSDGMDTAQFADTLLRPLLTNKYPGYPVVIVGDPAGGVRSQADSNTSIRVLQQKGFRAIKARTNSIQPRLAAVTNLLSGQIGGEAKHLISPNCKRLIAAMRSGYRYKKNTKGETEGVPDKNFYSHIADAHQYACLHVDEVWGGQDHLQQGAREIIIAPMRAWT